MALRQDDRSEMTPDPGIICEHVWEPIASLPDSPVVFAFAAPWVPLLEQGLRLEVLDRLGVGGHGYGTRVAVRTVSVMRSPAGNLVIAERHTRSAVRCPRTKRS